MVSLLLQETEEQPRLSDKDNLGNSGHFLLNMFVSFARKKLTQTWGIYN